MKKYILPSLFLLAAPAYFGCATAMIQPRGGGQNAWGQPAQQGLRRAPRTGGLFGAPPPRRRTALRDERLNMAQQAESYLIERGVETPKTIDILKVGRLLTRKERVMMNLGRSPGNAGFRRAMKTVDDALNRAVDDAVGDSLTEGIAQPSRSRPARASASNGPKITSDIDRVPNANVRKRSDAHAIVIGVENYRQDLPKATYATSDAKLVAKYLTKVLGYDEENVAVLINDRAAQSDFKKYFESWLKNRVEKGDEVFVYFSGHGAPNPKTGDAYMVPYDGDPTYLKETAYPLKRMYRALGKLPAGKITVVIDSCFSGAGGRSVIAKGARPLVTKIVKEKIPSKVTVMAASARDQISFAYDKKGHGLFTYYFLKGLGAEADEGEVDMQAVFSYAAKKVSRIARREFNSDQTPQMRTSRR